MDRITKAVWRYIDDATNNRKDRLSFVVLRAELTQQGFGKPAIDTALTKLIDGSYVSGSSSTEIFDLTNAGRGYLAEHASELSLP